MKAQLASFSRRASSSILAPKGGRASKDVGSQSSSGAEQLIAFDKSLARLVKGLEKVLSFGEKRREGGM